MKVCIFESEHFESAYPVIKFFDDPKNELFIFTTPETYNRFTGMFKKDIHKYHWIILSSTKSRFHFFLQMRREIENIQPALFFINTIPNNHYLFARLIKQLKNIRVIVTIHDINCMFRAKWSFNPKQLLRRSGKKSIVRGVKEFNVISDTMIPYLAEKSGGKKVIHNIPGSVFEKKHKEVVIENFIHLVIPGSVDRKRRNYEEVFALAELAENRKINLQITILGGHRDEYGKSVIKKSRDYSSTIVSFNSYDTDVVAQDEFDNQMNLAHFIYIPSVIHTAICDNIQETYGVTKSSGSIFDVVKHAKPFIIPQQLKVPANLESSGFRYASVTAIAGLLEQLLQEKNLYTAWQQKALVNSEAYTIEKIRSRNQLL